MKPWKLLETKYQTIKENQYNVAILPTGATEPHNLHMPYGTDTLTAERIGDLCCQKAHEQGAKVILLPPIPYGADSNLMEFPLTISINPSTLDIIIQDIVHSLEKHNIHKLVLLNGHGGNLLKQAMHEFYGQTDVFISLVEWFRVINDVIPDIFDDEGDHAGEIETSVFMALFPELVDLSLADDGETPEPKIDAIRKGWAQITRPWHIATTNSGFGNPKKSTIEKGQKAVDIVVERVAQFLVDLSAAEQDEKFPY